MARNIFKESQKRQLGLWNLKSYAFLSMSRVDMWRFHCAVTDSIFTSYTHAHTHTRYESNWKLKVMHVSLCFIHQIKSCFIHQIK